MDLYELPGGFPALFNGLSPNVFRAMLMTSGQLATYDVFKQYLVSTVYFKDDVYTHFTSSLMAGFVATLITAPADLIKTRIMNAKKGYYKGIFDCLLRVWLSEGSRGLFKGFVPAYVRQGPHTMITFLVLEQLKHWKL